MSLTVLLRRSGPRWAAAPRRVAELVSLWVRRWLTAAFLKHEQERLLSLRYSPSTLIEADREMIGYLQWLTTLPQA